jgi:large subunit ribosomal protein L25
MIPAVVYGKDTPSTSIQMGVSDFTRLYRETGKNHIISLSVDGKPYNVLVHDSQRHPVSGSFLHIDFLVVDMKAQVHVQIPVKLVGISPAVIEGGEMHHLLHAVDVKCLPADMVDSFDIDISAIVHAGQLLHVSDIVINPKKYTVMTPADTAVVSVQTMK